MSDTYTVTNAQEFNALPSLNAGDFVLLKAGNYGTISKTLVSMISDDATAQNNPIYVIAEVPGAVDITAPSQINLQGRGIVLGGLDFISGSGMLDKGSSSPTWILSTAVNSRHMRISNMRFLNCTEGDDYGR